MIVTRTTAVLKDYMLDARKTFAITKVTSFGTDIDRNNNIRPFFRVESTVFHPQGGGQPCDVGTIASLDGKKIVQIIDVQKSKIENQSSPTPDFEINHYTEEDASSQFKEGEIVMLKIDEKRRLHNAKLHTAGHYLSHLIQAMCPGTPPAQGNHFPAQANVKFKLPETPLLAKHVVKQLQLNEDAPVTTDAVSRYLTPYIANLQDCPVVVKWCTPEPSEEVPYALDGKIRKIQIGENWTYPCGGTHVSNLSEIGKITIRKIELKKQIELAIKYDVPQESASQEESKT